MKRFPSNCLLFGLWVWARSRFRSFLALGRSVSFAGLIPHARVFGRTADTLYEIDYAPPAEKRKERLFDEGEWFVLFDGEITLRKYVLVKEVRAYSFSDAVRLMASQDRKTARQKSC